MKLLVYSLALWNVLIMNNALHIKEKNDQDVDFWPHLACFLWSRGISRLPLRRLKFHLRVILVDPRLVARDDLPYKVFISLCFLEHVYCHRQAPFLLFGDENNNAQLLDFFDRSSQRTERHLGPIPCPKERGSSRTPHCTQGCPKVYPQPNKKISLGTFWSHLVNSKKTYKDVANNVPIFGRNVHSYWVNCCGLLCCRTLEGHAFIQEPECTPSTS